MKKIALFGASGGTGQQFLQQALEAGYTIKALARSPEKITQQSPQLTVIQGDVLKAEDVIETIRETDLVVSLFGHVKGSPAWLQTDGTRKILTAMQAHGVERIISLSGGGLPFPEKDQPKFMDKLIRGIMKLTVPKILNDAIEHHKVLRDSDRSWTIVRGPVLTDGPHTGTYRTGWVGVDSGTKISRADLADFILQEVEANRYAEQMPFVSY